MQYRQGDVFLERTDAKVTGKSAIYRGMTPKQRWFFSVRVAKTGCWVWTGRPDGNGYGGLKIAGRSTKAHRFGYEFMVGPIPNGLEIDHLCRNRLCVNPTHLEPVTTRENILRGVGRGAMAARMTHCKLGHPLSGDNLYRRPNGRRRCRECNKSDAKSWRNAK